jgi:hypothetical protein
VGWEDRRPLCAKSDIVTNMKTISLSVSEKDYEAFRAESVRAGRSIASLIRDAMSDYRESLGGGRKLTRVRPFEGVGPVIGRGRGGNR